MVQLFEKSPVFKQVQSMLPQFTLKRGKKKPARPSKKLKATWKLLQKAWCPCLRFPMKPSVCSCKTCTLAEQMLYRYNKMRPTWHQKHTTPCTKCNSKCGPGTLYRGHSTDPLSAIRALTCPSTHQPHLDIPRLDRNDRRASIYASLVGSAANMRPDVRAGLCWIQVH